MVNTITYDSNTVENQICIEDSLFPNEKSIPVQQKTNYTFTPDQFLFHSLSL